MNQSALIRPDWTPATIALMVVGFVVFWPLGMAMLAYIILGKKFGGFKRNANGSADRMFAAMRGAKSRYDTHFTTGNVAFDDWRKAEIDRMEDERRRLDDMRQDFDNYVRELRRAKDQEEFDRFMRDRKNGNSGHNGDNNGVVDL